MAEGTPLFVHRCRFIDFTPSPITALAFPPLPLPKLKSKQIPGSSRGKHFGTLAVGRANGNIELCEWTGAEYEKQAPQAWTVWKILPGPTPSKVDSLAIAIRNPDLLSRDSAPAISDLRLFSSGGGSELVEWDLDRGCILRTISSQGGAIWSISVNPACTLLALGCEDGCVRLLSLEVDTLVHHRRFDRVKCRMLSIAWGPPVPRQNANAQTDDSDSDDDSDEWSDSWLVTGGSDSSLRKWDVKTGRVMDRMGVDRMRGERTLVWSVGVLGDGTIVSGDSLGMVKFWDSRTCTQLQSFQGHGADVLCLAIGAEGNSVFTSGVDQKVCHFSLAKVSNPDEDSASSILRPSSRWIQSNSKRMHSHDVRALALWPPYTPLPAAYQRPFQVGVAPILASGGLDMSVVFAPCAPASGTASKIVNPLATSAISTFEDAYHCRMAYVTGLSPAVCIAREAKLVLCMSDKGVSLWRIPRKPSPADSDVPTDDSADQGGYEKVLDMELKTNTNLIASAISDDGRWLAVSDLYQTKLFSVTNMDGEIRPKRIKDFANILQDHLPKSPSTGASTLGFSPDSAKLVLGMALTSCIVVIDLGGRDQRPQFLRKFDHHRLRDAVAGDRAVRGIPGVADGHSNEADMDVDVDVDIGREDEEQVSHLNVVISRMAFSVDGQWLATADDRCRTHIYNLDAVQHHCVVPSMPQRVHALAFDPASPAILVLGLANNAIEVFDVEARRFPEWSRELCSALPQRFTHLHDPVLGVTFDPAPAAAVAVQPSDEAGDIAAVKPATSEPYALFWGATWLCKVKLGAPVGWGGFSKKRRRDSKTKAPRAGVHGNTDLDVPANQEQETNFKVVTRYRPILFVDFLAAGELVVIERPLLDVLATLPPAYFKPKYGS